MPLSRHAGRGPGRSGDGGGRTPIATHGLILKQGTIIDATVVSAAVHKPARVNQPSRLDPRCPMVESWQRAHQIRLQGPYLCRSGLGLIRKSLMTPASTHDSAPADQLIMGDEAAVYADKAYDKKERRRQLRARGAKDRIMHKGNRGRPITVWQARRNRLLATLRSPIERTFGIWKRWYDYRHVRYRGLARNNTQLQLLCIAFNLRRALVLQP
ncbi:MAG: transposase [Acetobacteraceae bacterium]